MAEQPRGTPTGPAADAAALLGTLLENVTALLAVTDPARRVTAWNGALARLTGVAAAEAVGRPLESFAVAEEGWAFGVLLGRALSGAAVEGHEVQLQVADGGEARAAFDLAPIRGSGGEVAGLVAIGRDLTQLRTLEAAAEQAEKMAGLGRLAAGIVHELNNPLVAVTMYSESLQEKWALVPGAEADLEKIKAIREAGQRIQKLTRDLTAYARGGTSRAEPVDLAPVLDLAARLCKPAMKESGAQVERSFEVVPQVVASRSALVQCFVNLISNAAQASGPGAEPVRLRLAAEGGRVVVTVTDAGAGMSPDVARRAFEPFFTTRPGKAIGLGLATARGIVERHGGTLTLESEPGRGTIATVSLPAKDGS